MLLEDGGIKIDIKRDPVAWPTRNGPRRTYNLARQSPLTKLALSLNLDENDWLDYAYGR